MNNIVLNFEGPYGLTKNNDKILFQEAISKKCGSYLWAIPYNNKSTFLTGKFLYQLIHHIFLKTTYPDRTLFLGKKQRKGHLFTILIRNYGYFLMYPGVS